MAWTGWPVVLALLVALGGAAQPAGGAGATLPERKLLEKTHAFLERFCRLAPERRITEEVRPGSALPGFVVVRYRLVSPDARFNQEAAFMVTRDARWAFIGKALALPRAQESALTRGGLEALCALFSRQAGYPVQMSLDRKAGPAGAYPLKITHEMPVGALESEGALSADGRWFFMGTFLPLGGDPRKERMRRLELRDNPTLGPAGAKVTLVEFADYSCSICAEFHPLFEKLVSEHPGQVRLVHVDVPHWQANEWAMEAAVWARCVAQSDPEAFWPFARAIFPQQGGLTAQNLDSALGPLAEALGASPEAVETCRREGTGRKAVLKDMGLAMSLDLLNTPTLLLDGTLMDRGFEVLLEPAVREALGARSPAKAAY